MIVEPNENDEAGQVEATEIPEYTGPADAYIPDPNYDPANDSIDPETQGESDLPGTPGAVGESFISTDPTTPTEIKEP